MTILELLFLVLSVGFGMIFLARHEYAVHLAIAYSLAALLVGVCAGYSFNKSLGFQYLSSYSILSEYNLSLTFGADGLSMVFLLLTLFIFPVCFLAAWAVQPARKQFILYLYTMEFLLVLTFTTLDLFLFFVFFESLLIPMFLLIGI